MSGGLVSQLLKPPHHPLLHSFFIKLSSTKIIPKSQNLNHQNSINTLQNKSYQHAISPLPLCTVLRDSNRLPLPDTGLVGGGCRQGGDMATRHSTRSPACAHQGQPVLRGAISPSDASPANPGLFPRNRATAGAGVEQLPLTAPLAPPVVCRLRVSRRCLLLPAVPRRGGPPSKGGSPETHRGTFHTLIF